MASYALAQTPTRKQTLMETRQTSRKKALKAHRRLRRKVWTKKSCLVYVLREAPGMPIRYVGQTRVLETERLRWHIKAVRRGKRTSPAMRWIAALLDQGITPTIEIIDRNGIWDVSEAVWIDRLRRGDADLLNVMSVVPLP